MLKFLEQIFEEERDELTCKLEPFVSIVIFVIKLRRIVNGINDPPDHESQIPQFSHILHASRTHVVISQSDMREYDPVENILNFLNRSLVSSQYGPALPESFSQVLLGLPLSQDVKLRSSLET